MCYKIALRERGKSTFDVQSKEYDTYDEANMEAISTVNNSGFSGYQIWKLADTFVETTVFQQIPKDTKVTS